MCTALQTIRGMIQKKTRCDGVVILIGGEQRGHDPVKRAFIAFPSIPTGRVHDIDQPLAAHPAAQVL